MRALTPTERRAALIVVALLALGAARDLWRAAHPRIEPGAGGRGAPPGATATGPDRPAAADSARVDLNRAGPRELEALPGVGPVLARRIAEHRLRHGPFRRVDELRAVRGIGPRLLERIRPLVTVSAPPR